MSTTVTPVPLDQMLTARLLAVAVAGDGNGDRVYARLDLS
jgi:hypothetical protein